jgi:predicted acyl esterase
MSEGNIWMIGRQEGKDCYDLIEWLAVQNWCNTKVGMSGTSYLSWAAYFAAAEKPPHLAAINPCEGLSDGYRDLAKNGGLPDLAFIQRLQVNHVGSGLREDLYAEAVAFPSADSAIWTDKIPLWDKVKVPCYLVASYSNTLHAAGAFRAWRSIASTKKWLRIHNSMEWPDYYNPVNIEDLRSFFDRYLKGVVNTWESTPRVRYALHDFRGTDRINQAGDQFPPTGVSYQRFYLDGRFRRLVPEIIAAEVPVTYDTQIYPAFASFTVGFTQETVIVGYPKVHLYVEAKNADDMDLFVMVQKLDRFGNHLQQFVIPNQGAIMQDFTENGASILKYKGPHGRLRVSARHLSDLSTDEVPAHSFDVVEKLVPAQVVEIDIALLPVGVVFNAGEQLRLVISSKNEMGAMMPGTPPYVPPNQGQHVIHTGGARSSYLQLPVQLAP